MPRLMQQILAIVVAGEGGAEHEQRPDPERMPIRCDVEDRLAIAN